MIERNRKTIQNAKVRLMFTRISPSYPTGVDAHAYKQVAEHGAPVMATELYERKHFKEMTYTGLLPSAAVRNRPARTVRPSPTSMRSWPRY